MTTDVTGGTGKGRIANPLLTDLWMPWAGKTKSRTTVGDNTNRHLSARQEAIMDYSYAIPTDTAIAACKRASVNRPLLELGSGTGYWAKMLSEHGMHVTAVEREVSADGSFSPHFPSAVQGDAVQYLQEHSGCADHVLFLCWPRKTSSWLDAYHGDTVIWVGEIDGCTWRMPIAGWVVVDRVPLPTWGLVHDYLLVYKRIRSKGDGTNSQQASGRSFAPTVGGAAPSRSASQVNSRDIRKMQTVAIRLTMSPKLPIDVGVSAMGSVVNNGVRRSP